MRLTESRWSLANSPRRRAVLEEDEKKIQVESTGTLWLSRNDGMELITWTGLASV